MADPEAAFENSEGFVGCADGFRAVDTPFDAHVRLVEQDESTVEYVLDCQVPSLDAVVEGDTLSDALLDGWAETMARRLGDAGHATSLEALEVDCSWDRDQFEVVFRIHRPVDRAPPIADLLALVGYLEGTYLQGLIPGYSYQEPAAGMLEQAERRGRADG